MKKTLNSFFTLLLLAAVATTATAQEPTPKLAVLVVGMDDWMLGDVLAHLVGEELNRNKTYDVVTRESYVQNKLEALRRGADRLDEAFLRTWATGQGINTLCLVTTTPGLNFSLKLLDVLSGSVQCKRSRVEPNAVALKQLAWSLAGNPGDGCTPDGFTESEIGMEMVYVEGGTFKMGCKSGRDDINNHNCENREKPAHNVTVGSFWIGKYEVTQGQWQAVKGTTISQQRDKYNSQFSVLESTYGVGSNYPMYYVSWMEAIDFCAVLSARTGKSYRLATEEEWEYAARGGSSSLGYVYSGGNSIGSVAWSDAGITHAVGSKSGNELGIYDMSGNVCEWCISTWRSTYSASIASADDSYRVVRGGSYDDDAEYSRVAYRSYSNPSHRRSYIGFRVV